MFRSVDTVLLERVRRADERKGLMPRSIQKKQMHLRSFMAWSGDILSASREDIEQFLDARNIGPKTRYCWLSHLRVFYHWAIAEGFCVDDPTEKIIAPKLRRNLPRPATTSDLQRALEKAPARQRCWVLLAAFEGLRCQEIAGLRREDVLEGEGLLRIAHAKGGYERVLPLHPEVLEALEHLPMPTRGPLFLLRGKPFLPRYLSRDFNTFLEAQGVAITAHQLRHWFGTHLYSQTHDLRLVQELLGHRNPNTTAIYTALDPSRGRSALVALHIGGDAA